MTLIEVGMHLITCLSVRKPLKKNFVEHDLKLCSEFIASSIGIIISSHFVFLI